MYEAWNPYYIYGGGFIMNPIKIMAMCVISGVCNLFGFAGVARHRTEIEMAKVNVIDGSNYEYEACDGVTVKGQYLDYTYYIYSDRDFDDIINKRKVTEADMNYLIDHIAKIHPDSVLIGKGLAFIKASNATGLDPIFLLSLVGIESGWGTNKTHLNLCNLYSIGMFGDGSRKGEDMGDSIEEGIIEGAKFIYKEYYKNGQTTVYSMNHKKDHSYCDGDSSWETQIVSEMNYLEGLLEKR